MTQHASYNDHRISEIRSNIPLCSTMSSSNSSTALGFFDALRSKDWARLEGLLSPDFQWTMRPESLGRPVMDKAQTISVLTGLDKTLEGGTINVGSRPKTPTRA